MHQDVELERHAKIKLNPNKASQALEEIAQVATRNRRLGLAVVAIEAKEPEAVPGPEGETQYRYAARIRLKQTRARSPEKALACYRHAYKRLARKARAKRWRVVSQPPTEAQTPVVVEAPKDRLPLRLPDLTPELVAEAFAGIYEREAHIRLIHDAMRTFVATQGRRASHILLYGEPAAAKTSLVRRFKGVYERDGDVERVVFLDAQTMTKAGLEDWLLAQAEAGQLPEVIVVEELEKQDEKVLLPLISVMGSGYLMKTNARVGRWEEQVRVMIWGTCNNEALLRRFHAGALWSRFTHQLPCVRPGREVMRRILLEEVAERRGDPGWADAALAFACEELHTTDPRQIVGLLDGGDRLLTGAYQADYRAIREAARQAA
jgi:hypothetical protein